MCGIAGYFNLYLSAEEGRTLLRQMCDTLVHRGPDDEGYFTDTYAGLGMRRLSIIDLAGGHQPIANEDGSKQIVFNGEIYNFASLRPALEQRGHHFTTASDTEVILHQYEQEGAACVRQLNGMFAFAIWDSTSRRLLLARDRLGIKPLYYSWDGQSLLFASEIKALLATRYVQRHLNPQSLWDYLTFRYVPQPATIWQHISKLLPGHTLTISLDNPEPRIERYWDIPYDDHAPLKPEQDYLREFEDLFLDAVRLRLIADVPVGILLSGGLDSSAVAAAVAEVHNARLHSFSVAFQDSPAINELPFARQVAQHTGTHHHEIVIDTQDFCDFLPRLVHATDEPLADLAAVPLAYVSYLARQQVKVVLSGEGSDEVLGGYHFDVTVRNWERLRQLQRLPRWLRRDLPIVLAGGLGLSQEIIERIWRANMPLAQRNAAYPITMTSYYTSAEKQRLLRAPSHSTESLAHLRHDLHRVQSSELLHQALYLYCQSWLVEDLLMKADRMTMTHSLELRVPFLDHRLVEWAARIPPWLKVGRNGHGQYETKRVLRHFARQRLPATILARPKQGFPVPVYDWLGGRLKSWAADLLTPSDAHLYRWLDYEQVQALLQRATHQAAPMLEKHRIWNLLILELWLQEWQPAS